MPENPQKSEDQKDKTEINSELPVRDLTQTDRSNKRLLKSFLERINADTNNPLNQNIPTQSQAEGQEATNETQDFSD